MNNIKPIIVLGMHRSGTSVMSHCLIRMGVRMAGNKFLDPDVGNPAGYWEDVDFLKLNKKILAWAGGEWCDPSNRKDLLKLRQRAYPEIKKLVEQRAKVNSGLWGWKDPRNSLLAHLYHELYPKSKFIVMRRTRPAIIRSLKKLRGDKENWSELCRIYNDHISAFLAISIPRHINVDYKKLVTSRRSAEKELHKVCGFVGIDYHKKVFNALDVIRFIAKDE